MHDAGVAIDDLYALVNPRLEELQLPANVHYTAAGYDVLGRQVAESILRALDVAQADSLMPHAFFNNYRSSHRGGVGWSRLPARGCVP